MEIIVILLLFTFTLSLSITPMVLKLSIRKKIYAVPNHRTIHNRPIPKLGGVSMFLAFVGALTFFLFLTDSQNWILGLFLGCIIIFLVGFLDDLFDIGCYPKLIGQTIAALVAVYFGFVIHGLYLSPGYFLNVKVLCTLLSIFWIVSITNALNLLDGLDGLASGIGVITASFISIAALLLKNDEVAAITFMLIAAMLGFIPYNIKPARIFMGDTGSLFLGFTLACLSLKAFQFPHQITSLQLLLPLIILFMIPLTDTSLAILRRLSLGQHPFQADRKHIHHRLLEKGFTQIQSLIIILITTFVTGFSAIFMLILPFKFVIFSTFVLSSILTVCLKNLRCFDFLTNDSINQLITETKIDEEMIEIDQDTSKLHVQVMDS